MRVNIEFEGTSTEFEQFCETPQRMAHQMMQVYYQGLLANPQSVGLPPVQPPLLSGQVVSALPAVVSEPDLPSMNERYPAPLLSGLLPPIAVPKSQSQEEGWRLPKLTTPLQCFLVSALISIGIVVWARSQSPLTPPQAPVLKPSKANLPTKLPPLPLIPRPGEKRP
jgi:hypothetical protein